MQPRLYPVETLKDWIDSVGYVVETNDAKRI